MNLRAIFLFVAIPAALALVAFWIHDQFHQTLEVAIALVALTAVGAAVLAIPPGPKSGRCDVANPYLTITQPERGPFVRVEFEAKVFNGGEQRAALTGVECLLYRTDGMRCDIALVFGAEDIATGQGQVLPSVIEPGRTYMVKARQSVPAQTPLGRVLLDGEQRDFVLRSRFRFQGSRPVTLRVYPHDLNGRPPLLRSLMTEFRLRRA